MDIHLLSTILEYLPARARQDAECLLVQWSPSHATLLSNAPHCGTRLPAVGEYDPEAWAALGDAERRAKLIICLFCLHNDLEKAEAWLYAALLAGKRVLVVEYASPERNLDVFGWLVNIVSAARRGEAMDFLRFSRSGGLERLIRRCEERLNEAREPSTCRRLLSRRYGLNRFVLEALAAEGL